MLYRAWKHDGDGMLVRACSPALIEAITRGIGAVDYIVFPHSYSHLARLAGTS